MHKKILSFIKANKKILVVSISTSLLTMLIIFGVIATLLVIRAGSISKAVDNLVNGRSNVIIQRDNISEQSNVIDVVAKANPAVVSIIISKDVPTVEQYYQNFNSLFGGTGQSTTQKQDIGGGSGFFVSNDGYIITNKHVVDDTSADYTVFTNDGSKYAAKVIAKDLTLDVAVLKVDGSNFPYLSFADSENLKQGQTVIAIGNALAEFRNSVSTGVISGLSRSITAGDSASGASEQLDGVIQTDAAINPGNSGGPLLDLGGNVIGVNVATETSAQNIGFALPGNIVKEIAESVKTSGEIVQPYLGVRYVTIDASVKAQYKLSVDSGILITNGGSSNQPAIVPGSPAEKAGLVENDIIVEIDGVKIDQTKSLATIIRSKQVGQTIKVKILHSGSEKTLDIKLEKSPKS